MNSDKPHKVNQLWPFKPIKARTDREYRCGKDDAASQEQAILDSYELLEDAVEELTAEEREAIQEHFNNCNPGDIEGLGDALFGSSHDFESKLSEMKIDNKTVYFKELIEQGIFDKHTGAFRGDVFD